jgi:fructose-specific phosphotransferase system IIA component
MHWPRNTNEESSTGGTNLRGLECMKISDILTEQLVVTGLEGGTKNEIIDRMIDLVATSPKVVDKARVREAIFEREKIMSTGVGNGFAIPHGKTDAVSDIVAAFAVTSKPIDYDSLDEKPVRLVFLLVGKDNLVGPHIKLLSRISRLMNREEFRRRLLDLGSPKEILECFRSEEASHFES